jgi:outer membrane protein assembly factor BamB
VRVSIRRGAPATTTALPARLLGGAVLVRAQPGPDEITAVSVTVAVTVAAISASAPHGRRMGGPGAGRPQGRETVGTVQTVEDGTVYLRTMDGSTVTTGDATTVRIATRGPLDDLEPGARVSVRDGGEAVTITLAGERR